MQPSIGIRKKSIRLIKMFNVLTLRKINYRTVEYLFIYMGSYILETDLNYL